MNSFAGLEKFNGELAEAIREFCLHAQDAAGRTFAQLRGLSMDLFLATARGPEEKTLLHLLCTRPIADEADRHVAEAILNGADPNAVDDRGRTPLHEVCSHEWGHINTTELRVIDLLLRAGAVVDRQDNRGHTPLFESVCFIRELNEFDHGDGLQVDAIVELLIRFGAGVNVGNADLITPLHVAVANNDVPMVELLLRRGASPYVRTTGTSTLYDNRLILLDNHAGVPVPIGSTALDLCRSPEMKATLDARAGSTHFVS